MKWENISFYVHPDNEKVVENIKMFSEHLDKDLCDQSSPFQGLSVEEAFLPSRFLPCTALAVSDQ